MTALLELRNVSRSYPSGEEQVAVLKDISLQIHAGEMVAIVGVSGSGKSTLMNILGCLDKPTSGTYRVAGRDVSTLDPDALAQLRREHFGFIFQRYHLLSHLTAAQMLNPAVYAGIERKNARRAPESCFAAGIKRSRRLPTFTAFWRTAAACQHCPRADERRTGDSGG
ncbi:macrolide transporter ATP-binding /permease protein [Salmonella enterica subsp. enterica serovar Montevideo str. 531954]|nr:macrolide transporter ATP-binding /permease protein [Salmonella enterica subsp. enterica serovar Montevideo str. 531954]